MSLLCNERHILHQGCQPRLGGSESHACDVLPVTHAVSYGHQCQGHGCSACAFSLWATCSLLLLLSSLQSRKGNGVWDCMPCLASRSEQLWVWLSGCGNHCVRSSEELRSIPPLPPPPHTPLCPLPGLEPGNTEISL